MTPAGHKERWRQIKEVLAAALDVPRDQRAGVLDRLCTDGEVRGEVENLLALEERAEEALGSRAAPGALLREQVTHARPDRIGPYLILRELGHGGMGVVYLGERADGEFKRQVAIKLITRGRSDAGLERRFRRERQILAQLEHPGIAQLFDGGATEDGQPYFVMEYIGGLRLLAYCDANQLSIADRVRLFLQVCDAVAYAHQRLIVHRDLKPANILVTQEGTPKLLDFGLARVLDSEPAEDITQTGFPVMTPAYASPEQVRGELFTVSGDVYSLGVILYELLSAKRPYDVPSGSLLEMVRVVCEQEPKPLSEAVTDDRLRRNLAGDLETIVAKALEKDAQRRYGSVAELALDLRRHLDGLPVHARPATFWYRAGKMLRRHRIAIPAGALAAVLILVFASVAMWQARQAQRRFEEVRKLAHSVMFDLHDAIAPLPGSTAARALLVRNALDYLERLSKDAAGDPGLAREVALGYARIGSVQGLPGESSLGNASAAVDSLQKSSAIFARLVTASSPLELRREWQRVLTSLAIAYGSLGQPANAARTIEQSRQLAEETLRGYPSNPLAIADLQAAESERADLLTAQEHYADALPIRQHVFELYEQLAAADPHDQERQRSRALAHKKLAALLAKLGAVAHDPARLEEGYRHYDQARVIDEALSQANPSNQRAKLDLSFDYSDMGWVKGRMADYRAQLAYYRKALALRMECVAADPKDARAEKSVVSSTGRIANALESLHDPAAIGEFKHTIVLWKQLADRPGAPWDTFLSLADAHRDLAEAYESRKLWTNSAAEYEQSRSIYASLALKGSLPKSLYPKITELAGLAEKNRTATDH